MQPARSEDRLIWIQSASQPWLICTAVPLAGSQHRHTYYGLWTFLVIVPQPLSHSLDHICRSRSILRFNAGSSCCEIKCSFWAFQSVHSTLGPIGLKRQYTLKIVSVSVILIYRGCLVMICQWVIRICCSWVGKLHTKKYISTTLPTFYRSISAKETSLSYTLMLNFLITDALTETPTIRGYEVGTSHPQTDSRKASASNMNSS